jgi:hypothetical protein
MKNQEPVLTKKVKMNIDEYAVIRCALENYIEKTEVNVLFFTDRLNASKNTEEVRSNNSYIKLAKENIANAKSSIFKLDESELITEHKLY